MTRLQFILLATLLSVLTACSPKSLVVGHMADMVDDGIVAFEGDDDLDLVEKAFPANIKLLEAMLANSPRDRQLLTLLSRLYGSYAFGFVETRLEAAIYAHPPADGPQDREALVDQVNRYYEKGIDYALRALENSMPGATDALLKVDAIGPYLGNLGPRQVAPLYWYGFNLGAWVNRNRDSIRAVSRAHVVRQVMQRVIELDPAYHHGGAHLIMMVYFGSRPPMMGGSQAMARQHYQQLRQVSDAGYLLPDLLYARFCLQQQQDREGFVALMQRIVDHQPVDSDLALYNAVAARRAAIYLTAVDSLFE